MHTNQDVIWDHFQNERVDSFRGANPRLEYLVRHLKRGEQALNIGIGSGELERLACRKGVEISTLDPNERAVRTLREELGMGDRARVGYGEQMPFDDASFDAIVMSEVLEHLEHSVRGCTLAEVRRVLKPGGRLIGTVPARERLVDNEVVCPRCQHRFHRWGHQISFDAASLRTTLSAHLNVVAIEERFFNEWDSVDWPRRLGGLLKKFLSWRGLGTYGAARNLVFFARRPA